jgi:hypothetical protein
MDFYPHESEHQSYLSSPLGLFGRLLAETKWNAAVYHVLFRRRQFGITLSLTLVDLNAAKTSTVLTIRKNQ